MEGLYLFVAEWAGEACNVSQQILSASASKHSVPFKIINEASDSDGLFDLMKIELVPTLLAMKGGKEVGRVEGVDGKSIMSLCSRFEGISSISPIVSSTPTPQSTKETKKTYSKEDLIELVNRNKLMLFIKGTPSRPQCGFTTQLLRLLSDNNLNFESGHFSTFNILEDEVLRAALKEWAQWPTYPQVYWKGVLIGGLDILKEMFGNGQMEEIIREIKANQ